MGRVILGIERILEAPPAWLRHRASVGLLVHAASVDTGLNHTVERLMRKYPGVVRVLFGPQHGLWGEKQDNMVLSPHERRTPWGVPAYSLYGETLRPTHEMLAGVDVFLVDLQDVGCRVYTYASTLLGCMEACASVGIKVVVADRPNPLGGEAVEGNLLRPSMESFVGAHPLPMRHGLTLGELAHVFQRERRLDVDLQVVPMKGWRRSFTFPRTGLPWVPPSPNMPLVETCQVYPGQVLLEGTNLSEGRGTTRPFEIFGAPFIDPFHLKRSLEGRHLPGVRFRPIYFEPTFQKWRGRRCGGLQIHVTDPRSFRPYRTTLWILHEIRSQWGDSLQWSDPPYEFETKHRPFDLLAGDPRIREGIDRGDTPEELEELWGPELERWRDRREDALIYA